MTKHVSHKARKQVIPSEVANLLHELSEGWYAPAISLSDPNSLVWGDVNLSSYITSISLMNNELVTTCELPSSKENAVPHEYPLKSLINQPLQICCRDGTEITARGAYVRSYGFGSQIDSSGNRITTDRVRIAASEWKLLRRNAKPILWVGTIAGELLDGHGNLTLLSKQGAFSSGHFYLQGDKYIYYIIQARKELSNQSIIAIFTESTDIDLGNIYVSIKNLAFCFGQTVQVKALHALSAEGKVVGNIGGEFGATYLTSNSSSPPIPIMYHDAVWIAPFYRKLSLHWNELGPKFDMALYYYIDSLGETVLDGAFVKIMVGIIALSELYLEKFRTDLLKSLFSNSKEWRKIRDKFVSEVSLMAKPGLSDFIKTQIQTIGKIDSSNTVEICLGLARIPINGPIHAALLAGRSALSGKLNEDKPSIYSQLACLRAVLVAIISRFIDYKGAISGWNKEDPYFFYQPAPEEWWNNEGDEEDKKEAIINYPAYYTTTEDYAKVQWPSFHRLTVPAEGIMAAVVGFANGLANKTGNVVIAVVQPLPVHDPAKRTFDFVIMLREHPAVKFVLFTIELSPDDVLNIFGWQDEILTLRTQKELNIFLSGVSESVDVQGRIQRLLQTADALSQGSSS